MLPIAVSAQDEVPWAAEPKVPASHWTFGFGLGLDYGGIGGQLQYRPVQPLSLFLAAGTPLWGFGYNAGMQMRIAPKSSFCPYVIGMYGYNAAIIVRNADEHNKIYYGTSYGVGFEIHRKRAPEQFWRFTVMVPQRPAEYEADMDALAKKPNVKVVSTLPSLALSVGYNFSW